MPATSPRSRRVAGDPRYSLRARRHLRRAPRCDAALTRLPPALDHASRRREPCRSLDRRPGRLHPHQCRRHLRHAAGGAAPIGEACRRRARERVPLPSHLDRRGVRLAGRRRAISARTRPTRRTRPIRPRRPRSDHLVRAWRHTYGLPTRADQLLEQLRALSFPRKADPADDPQRARGQAAAGLRHAARTCATGCYVEDHAEALLAVVERGQVGRELQHRRRAASGATSKWCEAICDLVDELAPTRDGLAARPDHLVDGPARPRPALRHRRRKIERELGWRPRADFRDRACARRCAGISTTEPGGRRSAPAPIAASGSASAV